MALRQDTSLPPSREDFARWQADRVTQWVMAAHRAAADANKAAWVDQSWVGGACSRDVLTDLRIRADAYLAIADTSYEGFCDMLGEEPNEE